MIAQHQAEKYINLAEGTARSPAQQKLALAKQNLRDAELEALAEDALSEESGEDGKEDGDEEELVEPAVTRSKRRKTNRGVK